MRPASGVRMLHQCALHAQRHVLVAAHEVVSVFQLQHEGSVILLNAHGRLTPRRRHPHRGHLHACPRAQKQKLRSGVGGVVAQGVKEPSCQTGPRREPVARPVPTYRSLCVHTRTQSHQRSNGGRPPRASRSMERRVLVLRACVALRACGDTAAAGRFAYRHGLR